MNAISIAAEARAPGKASARAVRRQGNVPCVLYGHHVEARCFTTSERSLKPLIFTNRTHIVNVSLGKDSWDCIIKDVAYHPVTDRPMHVDFQVLQAGEKVTLAVPLNFVGVSVGQAQGGLPSFILNELTVSCFPRNIPTQIDIDISEVGIGQSLHVRDLNEDTLDFLAPEDQILMTVGAPRAAEAEVEEGEEEIEEGEVHDE